MEATVSVNVRLGTELHKAAKKAALADHRTLTSLVAKLLDDYLKIGTNTHAKP